MAPVFFCIEDDPEQAHGWIEWESTDYKSFLQLTVLRSWRPKFDVSLMTFKIPACYQKQKISDFRLMEKSMKEIKGWKREGNRKRRSNFKLDFP